MARSIPSIDFRLATSSSEDERQRFVQEVGDALKDIGFFALTHHGIPRSLVDATYEQCDAFFDLDEACLLRELAAIHLRGRSEDLHDLVTYLALAAQQHLVTLSNHDSFFKYIKNELMEIYFSHVEGEKMEPIQVPKHEFNTRNMKLTKEDIDRFGTHDVNRCNGCIKRA